MSSTKKNTFSCYRFFIFFFFAFLFEFIEIEKIICFERFNIVFKLSFKRFFSINSEWTFFERDRLKLSDSNEFWIFLIEIIWVINRIEELIKSIVEYKRACVNLTTLSESFKSKFRFVALNFMFRILFS